MPRRHLDWMAQAEKDFKHAEGSIGLGDYEWSCFAAQQAAEKAIKALIESRNGKAFGYSVKKLLELLLKCCRRDSLTCLLKSSNRPASAA